MANIVFLGNFRVDYTTESHHVRSLESLGHTVIKLQETEAKGEEILTAARKSDLFVWVHTHGWKTPGNLNMSNVLKKLKIDGIPTMTYHLDLWLGLRRQRDLSTDPVYKDISHFFTVDSRMANWFNKKTSVKGHYMPAGVYDKEASYKPVKKFEHEVIFVGSRKYHPEWTYRGQLIGYLEKTYGSKFEHWGNDGLGTVRGKKLNELYASSKIVVGDTLCPNFNYPDYWSDRVYETLGRGGFIIHPHVPGMENEFVDKEHLVFYEYNNFGQLKSLIDYYSEHDEEREKIRLAGHKLVKEKYTYKNRWEHILKELEVDQ